MSRLLEVQDFYYSWDDDRELSFVDSDGERYAGVVPTNQDPEPMEDGMTFFTVGFSIPPKYLGEIRTLVFLGKESRVLIRDL